MVAWPGHWLCQTEPRINIIGLHTSQSAGRATGELVVEAYVRAGRAVGHRLVVVDWLSVPAADGGGAPCPRHWPIDAAVSLDEGLVDGSSIWFAELVVGVSHAQGGRQDLHCLVLVGHGDEATYRRVGYAAWRESDWMNTKFPERKLMKLRII